MPRRNSQPITIKPKGLSDAVDGTNAFPGAMSVLQNLIPSLSTDNQWVPRPASISATNFSGFTTPGLPTALTIIGDKAWGMIPTGRNAGKDEPFCYDLTAGAFVTIGNVTNANTPTSPSTTGDWQPPHICAVTNGRLIITHPGYDGITNFIGWIDISSFSSTTITGTTHTSTLIDTLSSNVLQAGWQIGMLIAGAGVPANTYIKSIAANGLSVVLSNPTTAGAALVALTVTGGTPAAPLYGAGQTNGVALVAVPKWVEQFNGRAWYAVLNSVQASDSLQPTQITNETQVLTLGDNVPVNCLIGVPFTNTVTGGAVQALIVFKGSSTFYQITGDFSTTITQAAIPVSVGTLAPNTLCSTPRGMAFVAPDGVRLLDLTGRLTDPVGKDGTGIVVPFVNAVNPTRMTAAFNQNVLRLSVQNGGAEGQPVQEYWLDFDDDSWSGPHTFPAAVIGAVHTNTMQGFLMAAVGVNGKLWESACKPSLADTYIENGVQLSVVFQPTLFPDSNSVSENCIIDSRIGLGLPSDANLTVLALDEQGNTLDTVALSGTGAGGSIWDSFNWGTGTWGGAVAAAYQQYGIYWHLPLVFKQMTVRIAGDATSNLVLGNLYAKNQRLGYPGL